MKQNIVMKVQMNCEKCRTKAMKIAAVAEGVISVAIEGEEKDRIVVVGDGVDSASLTQCLRKKLGHATLVSVEEVKPKPVQENENPNKPSTPQWTTCCHKPQIDITRIDYPEQPMCSIM